MITLEEITNNLLNMVGNSEIGENNMCITEQFFWK